MITLVLTALLAGLLAAYGTPIARAAAVAYGIVDKPDGTLKTHRKPVAYLGGLVVSLAYLVPIAIVFPFSREVLGILLAGILMTMLGLLDDLGRFGPGPKLVGQALAAVSLLKAGVSIQIVSLPEWASLALSFAWFMVMANAVNLIDVLDGLAAGVSAVAAAGFLVVALLDGNAVMASLSAALLGALVGFLPYNAAPASIYLGDAGSLFVGITLGALATFGRYTAVSWVGLAAPLLILAVPLFEMVFISYARRRRGMSILAGSHDHFALRLRRWGLSVPQAFSCGLAAALLCAAAGVAAMLLPAAPAAILLAVMASLAVAASVFLWRIA